MIIRKGHNEYLLTGDEKEIEIFSKNESLGVVRVSAVKNCDFGNDLINCHFDELKEVVRILESV